MQWIKNTGLVTSNRYNRVPETVIKQNKNNNEHRITNPKTMKVSKCNIINHNQPSQKQTNWQTSKPVDTPRCDTIKKQEDSLHQSIYMSTNMSKNEQIKTTFKEQKSIWPIQLTIIQASPLMQTRGQLV